MITSRASSAALAVVLLAMTGAGAEAQSAEPDAPSIRRWLDVQQLQLAFRYRRIETSEGDVGANGLQWQSQNRLSFLVDPAARFRIQIGAFTGNAFTSGWDNTGIGTGAGSAAFSVKQLFGEVEVLRGLDLQAGSLYVNRGETSEILSYDNDGYIMGERVSWHPPRGPIAEVTATSGYVGDLVMPNVFHRFRHMDEWNYGQLLVAVRMASRVDASADYTYEDGRDTLREGVRIGMPETWRVLRAIRAEAYQRLSAERGAGFNLAADVQVTRRLQVSGGIEHVDRHYEGFRGFGPLNADRFETGSRLYDMGAYRLTEMLTVGWFHDVGVRNDYPLENGQRFEILATINPTATLKRAGVF